MAWRSMSAVLILSAAVACSRPSSTTTLSGAAEKGPFVLGSTITVSPTDSAGNPSGKAYVTQTVSDKGDFVLDLSYHGLVSLQGDGFYYNEVTGALSGAPDTLRGFHEVSGAADDAYINMITHLTHDRIGALITAGMSFADARAQAEQELRAAMQLSGPSVSVAGDQMTLLGGDTDADAYLFAASAVVVQAGVTAAGSAAPDATIQELANTIAADLAVDGTLPADVTAQLVAAQRDLDTEGVKAMFAARLAAIGSTAIVPDIDRFIDSDGDGIVNASDNCPHEYNPDQADTYGFDRGDACSPSTIVIATGDQQTGAKSTALQPLVVTVTDPHGRPVAGWPITFTVTAGHGSVSPATATTDATGNAMTVLTLGTEIEHDTVTASTGYAMVSSVVFSADTVVAFGPVAAVATSAHTVSAPVTADFNGDGVPDVVFSAPFENAVQVMTNQTPTGATSATLGSPTTLAITAEALAVADLNQDGKPDLVAVGCSGVPGANITATAFINTTATGASTTSFSPGVAFSGSTCVSGSPSIAIGDLNGDGKPDMVLFESEYGVSPMQTSSISALVNTTATSGGSPSFASAVTLGSAHGAGVALVDIDRNGTLDVIIADNGSSGALSLLSNQTSAGSPTLSFAAPLAIPLTTTMNVISTIGVGDINGDGIPDLVVPDVSCQTPACNIAVLVNTTAVAGTPTLLETSVNLSAPGNIGAYRSFLTTLSLVDMDGDGLLDLVFDDGELETLYNATPSGSSTPTFPVQRTISSVLVMNMQTYGIGPFALADLNGDSLVDLVGCYQSTVGISMQR